MGRKKFEMAEGGGREEMTVYGRRAVLRIGREGGREGYAWHSFIVSASGSSRTSATAT